MATYNYTKSPVCIRRLVPEIKDALPDKAFDVVVSGSSVDCVFALDLDSGEQTTLSNTISAHDGAAVSFQERHKVVTLDKNTRRLKKTTWYAVKIGDIYSYPVREVSLTYDGDYVTSETEVWFSITGTALNSVTKEFYTEKQAQEILLKTNEV